MHRWLNKRLQTFLPYGSTTSPYKPCVPRLPPPLAPPSRRVFREARLSRRGSRRSAVRARYRRETMTRAMDSSGLSVATTDERLTQKMYIRASNFHPLTHRPCRTCFEIPPSEDAVRAGNTPARPCTAAHQRSHPQIWRILRERQQASTVDSRES